MEKGGVVGDDEEGRARSGVRGALRMGATDAPPTPRGHPHIEPPPAPKPLGRGHPATAAVAAAAATPAPPQTRKHPRLPTRPGGLATSARRLPSACRLPSAPPPPPAIPDRASWRQAMVPPPPPRPTPTPTRPPTKTPTVTVRRRSFPRPATPLRHARLLPQHAAATIPPSPTTPPPSLPPPPPSSLTSSGGRSRPPRLAVVEWGRAGRVTAGAPMHGTRPRVVRLVRGLTKKAASGGSSSHTGGAQQTHACLTPTPMKAPNDKLF